MNKELFKEETTQNIVPIWKPIALAIGILPLSLLLWLLVSLLPETLQPQVAIWGIFGGKLLLSLYGIVLLIVICITPIVLVGVFAWLLWRKRSLVWIAVATALVFFVVSSSISSHKYSQFQDSTAEVAKLAVEARQKFSESATIKSVTYKLGQPYTRLVAMNGKLEGNPRPELGVQYSDIVIIPVLNVRDADRYKVDIEYFIDHPLQTGMLKFAYGNERIHARQSQEFQLEEGERQVEVKFALNLTNSLGYWDPIQCRAQVRIVLYRLATKREEIGGGYTEKLRNLYIKQFGSHGTTLLDSPQELDQERYIALSVQAMDVVR